MNLSNEEVRELLMDLGHMVSRQGRRIVIDKNGKHVFAVITMGELELLEKLEQKIDLNLLYKRIKETTFNWEKIKKI